MFMQNNSKSCKFYPITDFQPYAKKKKCHDIGVILLMLTLSTNQSIT